MENGDAHILKASKVRQFPTVFYFLDTETTLSEVGHKTKLHSLKIGICQRYNRIDDTTLMLHSEIVILSADQFMRWFLSHQKQKSNVYLIAHNVTYDATILDLFRKFPENGYKLQSIYSKGQVTILRWKNGTSKITMLDNGNIFSGALERWGKIFDIPKISIDFNTCTYEELVIYCRRDVEIMVKAWQTWILFLTENDCGGFRETVGSTAFNTWRHKFLNREVYVHKEHIVLELERKAYHGGRVEAFRQGLLWHDHYYYLDINNMYGYIMKNFKVPVGLQGYSSTLSLRRMISYLSRYAVIADVTVNVDKPVFVSTVNGHVCYPLGRFRTTLTTEEIKQSLQNGWLEELHSFAWYKQDYLFKDFITYFYDRRMTYRNDNNIGFENICKLMINSLSGKFGQTGINQSIIGSVPYNEIWHMPCVNAQTGEKYYQTALGGVIFEDHHQGESYHSMPSIAAHITADARLYLYSLIEKAGSDNVFYCDTDSIIVNQMGYYNLEHMIEEKTLGMLKIETHSPWLLVNAPKDYEMSERKKIKGVRVNAAQINDNTFLQEQWIKLAGLIREGFSRGYTSKEIEKHQQRIIYSGVVLPTGEIEPFVLE